tara:strand:- start:795 stop:1457 length:663 start_codon:yes stop_codon:yes gene_type:complete
MNDLNNPYLTTQTKRDALALEVDKDYKREKAAQARRGNIFSSSSYWIISMKDLIRMNKASCGTDSLFNFYDEHLETLNPDFDVLLLAHDTIKKGEYDSFLQRWSTYSFTNVLAVGINGYIQSVPYDDREDIETLIDKEGINDYIGNKRNADEIAFGLGVIDIPQDVLDEYEDKRVYKRTYAFSKMFEQGMENVFRKAKNQARNRTRKLSINRRKKGGFGK